MRSLVQEYFVAAVTKLRDLGHSKIVQLVNTNGGVQASEDGLELAAQRANHW
jgi:hypothetical protein